MNRAELIEISRKAADGTQTAENILTYCKTEAEDGRGLAKYFIASPNEHIINYLRSRGLDVTYEAENTQLVIVWDQERENAYQSAREAMFVALSSGRRGLRNDSSGLIYTYATPTSVQTVPTPEPVPQSSGTQASGSGISGAVGSAGSSWWTR